MDVTMVKCILCGNEYHIGGNWFITYEEFKVEGADVDVPEIGICWECRNQEILSAVKDKCPEIVRSVQRDLEKALEEALAGEIKKEIADRIAQLEAQMNAVKEAKEKLGRLKDGQLSIRRI
jgi:BMFP domain-containing protein YqiC